MLETPQISKKIDFQIYGYGYVYLRCFVKLRQYSFPVSLPFDAYGKSLNCCIQPYNTRLLKTVAPYLYQLRWIDRL